MCDKKIRAVMALALSCLVFFSGCAAPSAGAAGAAEGGQAAPSLAGLTWEGSEELLYAKGFAIDAYTVDATGAQATLVRTFEGETGALSQQFLVLPRGEEAPGGLPQGCTVMAGPVENIYLAATAAMDMFISLDALPALRFSGTAAEEWGLEEAADAMDAGELLYAGKYSLPNYELLLDGGCELAVESTMILHTPKVKEQLEAVGIPVFVDRSSYEAHPLGRSEWVRVYGAFTGRRAEAEAAFAHQASVMEAVARRVAGAAPGGTAPTVCFFYYKQDGTVQVRRDSDYVARMIALAGGDYVFASLQGPKDTATASLALQEEAFYAAAKEADVLLYNTAINGATCTLEALVAEHPLLADFAAVQTGRVYATTDDFYQASMSLAAVVEDFYTVFTNQAVPSSELRYLSRLS